MCEAVHHMRETPKDRHVLARMLLAASDREHTAPGYSMKENALSRVTRKPSQGSSKSSLLFQLLSSSGWLCHGFGLQSSRDPMQPHQVKEEELFLPCASFSRGFRV